VHVKTGSQEDPSFLQSVAAEFNPTIIIDDGSHIAHHMIASFEALFPTLAPGGVYVFEDLSFHFEDGVGQWQGAQAHQGLSDVSIYDYLAPFVRARLANLNTPPKSWGFSRYAYENIDSVVAFAGGLALIKREPKQTQEYIALFRERLDKSHDKEKVQRQFINFLYKRNTDLDIAEELLKTALKDAPNDYGYIEQMYAVTNRLGRFEEALAWAHKLAENTPEDKSSWLRIANTLRNMGRPDEERKALERLVRVDPHWGEAYLRISQILERSGDLSGAVKSAKAAHSIDATDETANRVDYLERKSAALD
jgi:tetratricopeptide (TPR) repeat protein